MRHALLFTALVTGLFQVAAPGVRAQILPSASPETVGLSGERLAQIATVFDAEVDQGRLPGAVVAVARRGKLVYFEAMGYQDKPTNKKMQKELDLPRLFDDQALDLARSHDAGRGGQDPVARSGLQVPAGFQGTERQRRHTERYNRANDLRVGAGCARTNHPGSAAPHIGLGLRLRHPQRACQGGL